MILNEAIQTMTNEIVYVLADNNPTVYLFGSVVLDDFKLGWSDIDVLVLTEHEINEQQANTLVGFRQDLLGRYPGNPYFRLFEGGMLSADAYLNSKSERMVYWGTSGQRITDNFKMDSFGMAELLDSGVLLYGDDIRVKITYPTYAKMRDDIAHHIRAARKYGVDVGWLLDIARGIYTLHTGKIIAKTAAGEWALENGLCPDLDAMQKAVQIRKEANKKQERSMSNAVIQRFADVIDEEFSNTVQRFAESELQRMNIDYTTLSLIRDKDGVSVWRVASDSDSFVMKCFDKPEYRREIANYGLLNSLGVPTLKVVAHTDCSLVIEDIERSVYRLGTMEDINDPNIAEKIALWYKTLHQNGREYANAHDFMDEYDSLTIENLNLIQEKTGTSGMRVWQVIEEHFTPIRSTVMSLSRTLVYTDFHFTNLAVAHDGSSALIFDYNFLYKSYVYSDIRNVCYSLGNDEAKSAFLSAYGAFEEYEVIVDDVASVLSALLTACQRKVFPNWANDLLEMVKDGRLLTSVERLLEGSRNE
jgi:predicted nucleotidyltransferase